MTRSLDGTSTEHDTLFVQTLSSTLNASVEQPRSSETNIFHQAIGMRFLNSTIRITKNIEQNKNI